MSYIGLVPDLAPPVAEWAVVSQSLVDIKDSDRPDIIISGTTGISDFGVAVPGLFRNIRFQESLTITHSPSGINCPGNINLIVYPNDVIQVLSLGGGQWFVRHVFRSSGCPVLPNLTVIEITALSGVIGQMVLCTDEVDGSVPVFFDGTDWRRVTDRAVIS